MNIEATFEVQARYILPDWKTHAGPFDDEVAARDAYVALLANPAKAFMDLRLVRIEVAVLEQRPE